MAAAREGAVPAKVTGVAEAVAEDLAADSVRADSVVGADLAA